MKTPLILMVAALALGGCQNELPLPRKLAVGATPESVTRGFDGDLFVSLMGVSRKAGDGDGKVVRVHGEVVTDFTTGLNDPKGIVFAGGKLVTADFDTVWQIDAQGNKSALAGPKDFPSAPTFLNDVEVEPSGKSILVTDMGAVTKMRDANGKLWPIDSAEHKAIPVVARLFRVTLEGKVTEVIAPNARMLNPNGVDVLKDGRIRLAEFFTGDVLEYKDGVFTTIAKGHRSGDGIVHDSKGRFYISEVMFGRVTRYDADGKNPKLLSEGLNLQAAADIYVDEAHGQLIIPDSKAGELVFIAL
ncbi:MAG: SMP-30/gluconolactonase/LRE family protein [Verrucomicrobia bacterium]|nr:SMP-30/gluconolactonase/LRE family protein [Verrucomicrobiota bacterium]